MSLKNAGAAALATAVLLSCVFSIWNGRVPGREADLLARFPALASDSWRTGVLIHDPLLDPATAGDAGYQEALRRLVSAQYAVARLEAAAREREDRLAASAASVVSARDKLEGTRAWWNFCGCYDVEGATAAVRRAETDHHRAQRSLERSNMLLGRAREQAAMRLTELLERKRARLSVLEEKPDCPLLESNTVLLLFRDGADPNAIESLLRAHDLRVRSRIVRDNFLLLAVESREGKRENEEEEATRLHGLVLSLSDSEVVEVAVESVALGENTLPTFDRKVAQADWFGTYHPLVNTKFPEAWNFNDAIASHGDVPVGVLDTGFLKGHVDLPFTKAHPVPNVPECFDSYRRHGLEVAGVIGATWNGFGVAGGARHSKLVTCSPPPAPDLSQSGLSKEDQLLCSQYAAFEGYTYGLETLLAQGLRVVNVSVGYNWGAHHGIDPTTDTDVQELVAKQGAIVRKLVRRYGDAVIVASAGNDCNSASCTQPAKWTSPFNWAALGEPNNAAENVIVVMATDVKGTRLKESNVGGTISAIGAKITTTSDVIRVNNVLKPRYDTCPASTSCATPMVTATVAMMIGVHPGITVLDLKKNLGIGGADPHLNAWVAVTKSDLTPARDLADILPGTVNEEDFLEFKRQFVQIDKQNVTDDLNCDGRAEGLPHDAMFCRIDLNGDGKVTIDDVTVLCEALQTDCEALKKKLKEQ